MPFRVLASLSFAVVLLGGATAQNSSSPAAAVQRDGAAWSIEARPPVIELRAAAQLLVRDRARHGLSGLAVRVVTPDGAVTSVGITDADGLVDYLPEQVGRHAARITAADGVEVMVSFDVVTRPMRELWFVIGLLLAALFLRGPWRRWREARRGEPAAG